MMPLKVWPNNTALGCSHQLTCMPQLQLLCSTHLIPMYYPHGVKARVSFVQSIKPHKNIVTHSGLEPKNKKKTRTSGSTVQSSNHYTTAAHMY